MLNNRENNRAITDRRGRQLGGSVFILHLFNRLPKLPRVRATETKLLMEVFSLSFADGLGTFISDLPKQEPVFWRC